MVFGINHISVESGNERHWIVTVTLLEFGNHLVSPVLSACFVTVFYHNFECLAILRRYAAHNFSEKGIKVRGNVFLAHLVGFISRCFGSGGSVGGSRGAHGGTQNHPFAFWRIPSQYSVLEILCKVDNLIGFHHKFSIAAFV